MKKFNFLVFNGGGSPKRLPHLMRIMASVLMLFLGICNARLLNAQEQFSSRSEYLRLAIPDFKKIGGDPLYDLLKHSLPEMLAVSLIANDRVEYVNREEFQRVADKMFPLEHIQRNPDIIFESKVCDRLDIDLILRGTFFEYRRKIRFEGTLKDLRNNKSIEISPGIVDVRGINSGIEAFAKELNAAILALDAEKKAKRLAILCFKDESPQPLDSNNWLEKDLAISLISNLDLKKKITLLPWSQTKDFCANDSINDSEILNRMVADAVLRGKFIIEENNITVVPQLYIKEKKFLFMKDKKYLIELTKITGNLYDYYKLEDDLAQDVGNVLEAIVKDGGGWNIEPVMFTSNDKKIYLEKGKDSLDSERNTYLAALMFIKALEIDPDYDKAHYLLGKARFNQGRYQEALSQFKKTIEINSNYAEAYRELGNIYLEQGKYSKALEALKEASELAPDLPDIHLRLGEVYYILSQNDNAVQELNDAIKKEPKNLEIYNLLGRAYQSQGSNEKAIDAYLKALEIDPTDATVRSSLGNIYYKEGGIYFRSENYKEAINYFEKSVELDPNASVYHHYLGRSYFRSQEYKKATICYRKTINEGPKTDPVDYTNLAEVEIMVDSAKAALSTIEQILTLNESTSEFKGIFRIRDQAICYYLQCVAQKILNMDTCECEKKLDAILEQDFVLTWSFTTFKLWLDRAVLDEETKSFIKKKMRLIESKK